MSSSTVSCSRIIGNFVDLVCFSSLPQVYSNCIEAVLPEKLKKKLEKSLENSLKKTMKGKVTISFSKNVKGGFQIGPKGGTFKISLTDEDFNEFFKEYLRPKTRSFLFKE